MAGRTSACEKHRTAVVEVRGARRQRARRNRPRNGEDPGGRTAYDSAEEDKERQFAQHSGPPHRDDPFKRGWIDIRDRPRHQARIAEKTKGDLTVLVGPPSNYSSTGSRRRFTVACDRADGR